MFNSITRRPCWTSKIPLFLLISILILATACKQKAGSGQNVNKTTAVETGIHRLDTMLFSTPNTVEINPDSLIRKPVKGRRWLPT